MATHPSRPTAPSPSGPRLALPVCCGQPNDHGPVNTCTEPPAHVVIGTQVAAGTNEPVLLVLTCCKRHRKAVAAYQSQWEDALVAPIAALDFVLQDLGPDAWVAAPPVAEAV